MMEEWVISVTESTGPPTPREVKSVPPELLSLDSRGKEPTVVSDCTSGTSVRRYNSTTITP